jgi:dTDP-4-amino-4,6-dideoxygalactose transaminase
MTDAPTAGDKVPFNRPHVTGDELTNIRQAIEKRHLSGNGEFTQRCQELLAGRTGAAGALLTHSCTAALEMSALLSGVGPGDEVIMPSYTFVSTANAFVLRGAVPVFVDIRADTLNIDERLIGDAVTERTRAVVPVHYAGVGCEMDAILDIARRHGLRVVEDAAQGIDASYKGRPLGSIGDLGTLSFHETKNIISGEGGALLINDAELLDRAQIIWEKGTNRIQFKRGEVDKYTWVDIGSSYLPSEIVAAFLLPQLERSGELTRHRLTLWQTYHDAFAELEAVGAVRRPIVPQDCAHNGHLYHLLVRDAETRTSALARLKEAGIDAIFHYVPLHSAPAGRRFGRVHGSLANTDDLSRRLIRLPIHIDLTPEEQQRVIETVTDVCR